MGGHFYLIATRGHCFLCLKRVGSHGQLERPEDETVPKAFSLHKIYQYLKLTLKEALSETMPMCVSSSSLSVLEETELIAHLCEGCSKLSETFSKQFLELEEIQRKLELSLRSIYQKMGEVEGGDNHGRLEEFKKEMLKGPETLLQFGIVEQLRKKTLEGCSQKLGLGQPSVDNQPLHETGFSSNGGDIDIKMEDPIVSVPDIDPLMSEEEDVSIINDNVTDLGSEVKSGGHGPQVSNPSTGYPGTKEGSDKAASRCSSGSVGYTHNQKQNPLKPRRLWSYTCDLCGKNFANMLSLTKHRSKIHIKNLLEAPEKMRLDLHSIKQAHCKSIAIRGEVNDAEMEVADYPPSNHPAHLEPLMNEGAGTVGTRPTNKVMSSIMPPWK